MHKIYKVMLSAIWVISLANLRAPNLIEECGRSSSSAAVAESNSSFVEKYGDKRVNPSHEEYLAVLAECPAQAAEQKAISESVLADRQNMLRSIMSCNPTPQQLAAFGDLRTAPQPGLNSYDFSIFVRYSDKPEQKEFESGELLVAKKLYKGFTVTLTIPNSPADDPFIASVAPDPNFQALEEYETKEMHTIDGSIVDESNMPAIYSYYNLPYTVSGFILKSVMQRANKPTGGFYWGECFKLGHRDWDHDVRHLYTFTLVTPNGPDGVFTMVVHEPDFEQDARVRGQLHI